MLFCLGRTHDPENVKVLLWGPNLAHIHVSASGPVSKCYHGEEQPGQISFVYVSLQHEVFDAQNIGAVISEHRTRMM
jgi:hypothetical protein